MSHVHTIEGKTLLICSQLHDSSQHSQSSYGLDLPTTVLISMEDLCFEPRHTTHVSMDALARSNRTVFGLVWDTPHANNCAIVRTNRQILRIPASNPGTQPISRWMPALAAIPRSSASSRSHPVACKQ